jgi:hypothetical protein
MGGRGSSSGGRISVPDKRGPAGTRRKKIKVDQPGMPYGTETPALPLRPAGEKKP